MLQVDVAIHLFSREKIKDANFFCLGADTVDAPDALHQPCRIPRGIIIQDCVGPVQVHPFRQHLGCYNDVVIVFLLAGGGDRGIKVSLYHVLMPLPVFGIDLQYLYLFY